MTRHCTKMRGPPGAARTATQRSGLRSTFLSGGQHLHTGFTHADENRAAFCDRLTHRSGIAAEAPLEEFAAYDSVDRQSWIRTTN
jgi:hypothetical protein